MVRTPWRQVVAQLLGTAWLLLGVLMVCVGLSGALAAGAAQLWGNGAIAPDAPGATYSAARCDYLLEYYPQADGSCRNASIAHHADEVVSYRLAAGVVGAAALVLWLLARLGRMRLVRRLGPLTVTPPALVLAGIGAAGFGALAAVSVVEGLDAFMRSQPWGAWAPLVTGIAVVPAFVAFAVVLVERLRDTPVVTGIPGTL